MLASGITVSLSVLGVFKYYNFFINSCRGGRLADQDQDIVLPIGISFYTFHSLSYIIDIYRGRSFQPRAWSMSCSISCSLPSWWPGPSSGRGCSATDARGEALRR